MRKKRRIGRIRKLAYTGVFIIFFCSLGVLGLTAQAVRVHAIVVSGAVTVPEGNIIAAANAELDRRYLSIIPTDNRLLARTGAIAADIMRRWPRIASARVSFAGLDTIDIAVVERTAAARFCAGGPQASGTCYLMDAGGFVFAPAPDASSTSGEFSYFGLLAGDPIGQTYAPAAGLSAVTAFMRGLDTDGFAPVSFAAADEHEYQADLAGGAVIYMNDSQPLAASLANLEALVSSGYLKTDPNFLQNLEYVDLRYGNKVDFKTRS